MGFLNKKSLLWIILVVILGGVLVFYYLKPEKTTEQASGPQVPEGYTVEIAAGPDLVDFPMFSILDETGRLFVFESIGNVYEKTEDAIKNPQFRIKLLEDANGDGLFDKSTIYADKVGFPQGGVFYKGSLYASSAPDLLKLTDTDGDGVADKREVLLTGWTLNVNANSLVGPVMGPDGWLYMNSAIMGFDVTTKEGVRLKGETARTWRLRPDGSGLEWISAGGMNNPVELTFTEAGEPIGTETYFTDPKAGERDALVYWTEGGVYPKPNHNIDRDNLTRTGELMPVVSKYSRVAPSGIGRYRGTALGDGFKNNLFSAQFNTHRIIRHKLFRDGGSFRTEDEVFFSSKNEDFHPTDVLEDADGSLLVVETGGWFIKGCPLSQVSKPELKGSIYRVRRKGAHKTKDPYGNQIQWSSITPSAAAKYLEDERSFVADRSIQSLVDKGNGSIPALSEILNRSNSADARIKAVFSLYRIGSAAALTLVRQALGDKDLQVRIAAARSAGLAHDTASVTKLIELIAKDELAARRQASTALGQIGDKQAVPYLLAAADTIGDRFVRHAIIYSLVNLKQPQLIKEGLTSVSPKIQEAALIALDQMPSYSMPVGQLTPFLTHANPALQRTALWIAAHHAEWSKDLIVFLRDKLKNHTLTNDEENLYRNIFISFCGNADMQVFLAGQMNSASKQQKIFLLSAMSGCKIEKLPQAWIDQLGKQLSRKSDPELKARTLALIRLRGITSLSPQLRQLADDSSNSPELRNEAIAGLLKVKPDFSGKHFSYLLQLLKESNEAPLRQQVAGLLAQGKLSEEQLDRLAFEILPKADPFIVPKLVPLFEGVHSGKIGKTLASMLLNSSGLDGFTEENLQKVFAKYPAEVKPSVDQLMKKLKEARAGRLQRLQVFESQINKGTLDRGRVLFFGKAVCSTCHTIGQQGGKLGPDLTSIQRDRSAHDLLEAIVYPNASFVREFETYQVKTKSAAHTGIMTERTPDAIILATSPQSSVRIPRDEILATEMLDVSMMPQGLDKLLTEQEMADLMTFLLGQDQDPETDQRILRQ